MHFVETTTIGANE